VIQVEFYKSSSGSLSHADADSGDFGLMFFVARWYDPYLNRWIQPDTIVPDPANSGDWDRYAYVRNNPKLVQPGAGAVELSGKLISPGQGDERQIEQIGKVLGNDDLICLFVGG
jgi:RHS repeat-associated protein